MLQLSKSVELLPRLAPRLVPRCKGRTVSTQHVCTAVHQERLKTSACPELQYALHTHRSLILIMNYPWLGETQSWNRVMIKTNIGWQWNYLNAWYFSSSHSLWIQALVCGCWFPNSLFLSLQPIRMTWVLWVELAWKMKPTHLDWTKTVSIPPWSFGQTKLGPVNSLLKQRTLAWCFLRNLVLCCYELWHELGERMTDSYSFKS